jgi:hypothetical protein
MLCNKEGHLRRLFLLPIFFFVLAFLYYFPFFKAYGVTNCISLDNNSVGLGINYNAENYVCLKKKNRK